MHDKVIALARTGHGLDEVHQKGIAVLIVNPDPGFDRDRNRNLIAHRFHAIGHQLCITHQAGTEHAVLYPIRWTTHIQVNLIVTALLGQTRALRQIGRITTA